MLKRLLLISFCLLCKLSLYSQPICDIIHYDKLHNSVWSVSDVLQDKNDYMWFSTTNGLYRFDGYTFQCFKSVVGDGLQMTSNNIRHMYQDVNGNLWCLIGNRAFLFDTSNYTWNDVMAELEKSNERRYIISKIRVIANGQVWLIDNEGRYIIVDSSKPLSSARIVIDESIDSNALICTDSQNDTWIFTSSYSYIYRNGQLQKQDFCVIDHALANGYMWLLDNKGRLNVLNAQTKNMEPSEGPDVKESFYKIKTFSNGTFILLSEKSVYANKGDGTWTRLELKERIERFFESRDGTIWIQTVDNELFRLSPKDYRIELVSEYCNKDTYLYEDRHGTLWLLDKSGTLRYISSGNVQIEHYDTTPYDLQMGRIYVDNQGNLWHMNEYGINKLTFSKVRYEVVQNKNLSHVKSVYVDKKKRCWITERTNKAVALYSPDNTLLGYLDKDGRISVKYAPFSNIYSIYQDSKGRIWLGSKPDGLYRLTERQDEYSFDIEHFIPNSNDSFSISGSSVYHITEDKRGRIWIATHGGGINCIEDPGAERIKFINSNNILSKYDASYNKKIYKIAFTHDDIMLVASSEGLLVADVKVDDLSSLKLKVHKREADRKTSLSNSNLRSIFYDSKQRIFVCTENDGINQIISSDLLTEKLDFRHYSKKTGFPTDITQCVFESDNNLWVVGRNMLIELNPEKKDGEYMNIAFDMDNHVFSEALPARLQSGDWIFGLHNGGALVMDVTMKKDDAFVPNIVLSCVKIENHEYYSDVDTIELQPNERNLNIKFAALDYSNLRNIDYAYKMGENASWTYIGSTNNVSFVDLIPGTYRLTLRSTNGDGVWSDKHRILTIVVKPTFWETGWALLLYILIIVSIGYIVVWVRSHIRKIKKQKEEALESYMKLLDQNEQEQKAFEEKRRELQEKNNQAYDDLHMQRVMSFIKENIGNADISIEDMAVAVAISRPVLNRKVKQITGMTPLELIKTVRIQKACQMLKEKQYTINEVAYECGFSDSKYFSKCFKSAVGQTPTDYRIMNAI